MRFEGKECSSIGSRDHSLDFADVTGDGKADTIGRFQTDVEVLASQ